MTHIAFHTLLGYIEGQLSTTECHLVVRHLDTCELCQREFNAAQRMLDGLTDFALSEPEPHLIQRSVAAFRRQQQHSPERTSHAATLRFDSLSSAHNSETPGDSPLRKLLYSAAHFDLDLQIKWDDVSNTSSLYGQMISHQKEEEEMMGIPLRLSRTGADDRLGLTDGFGRFSFAYLSHGEYVLSAVLDSYDILIEPLVITP